MINSLVNVFGKSAELSLADKNKIAELLKVSPDALEAFEHSYDKNVLSSDYRSGNLMDVFGKEMLKAERPEDLTEEDYDKAYEIANRIIDELTAKYLPAYGLKYEGMKLVEKEEIMSLPKSLRPQLTSRFIHADISDSDVSTHAVLSALYNSLDNNKTAKERLDYYHLFRWGLDLLDLNPIIYEILSRNETSMSYWLPRIMPAVKNSFFKIPETQIIKCPLEILQLTRVFDYGEITETTKKIANGYCNRAFTLNPSKTYFVKTGTFSSKFDFRNAKVTGAKEVLEIGEYLLFLQCQAQTMSSPLNNARGVITYGISTTNDWVVREYIEDKENNPTIYKGMPLHTEYRVFVDFDTSEALTVVPYWEPEMMKNRFGHQEDKNSPHQIHDYILYQMHEDTLMERFKENKKIVQDNIEALLPNVNMKGQWSIDVMQNGDDFYIIDMAPAMTSALREFIPDGMLKKYDEDWLPLLAEKQSKLTV